MRYAKMFHTDPSITEEELTAGVLEEIGELKYEIIQAALPYWQELTGGAGADVLAIELEPLSPDFIRALAAALQVRREN